MEAKQYAEAIRLYEKAVQGQPNDARMYKALGEALNALAREKPVQDAFVHEKRAMEAFEKAALLIPIDAEAHYGLARSSARLEQMHPLVHPDDAENPYNPLPAFHKAIELRPNGILYRYALARHLYLMGDIRAFRSEIQELVRIYPPTYTNLKKEPFWSEPLEAVATKGLHQALEAGIMPQQAHMALSAILERQELFPEAIRHYTLALQESPRDIEASQSIHMGRLYLQAGQPDKAEQAFLQGLRISETREIHLERVFSAYKKHDQTQSFIVFFNRIEHEIPFSIKARLVVAKALIQNQSYFEARQLLERLNRRSPTSEAYYLLYTIAKEQNDLDRMELAIQKTTVLAPQNSRYYYLFSRVLRRAGKLESAEKAASRALALSEEPRAELLHNRAKLRRGLNDPSGALSDWEAAIALSPEKAAYHAHASEMLKQLARFDQALEHANKAASLEPENERYQSRYTELKKQLEQP